MTASNIATLVDDAAVLNNEIKRLTAQLDAIKAQFKQAGVGEYEGHLATVTISQNKDTEGFDYKKAFEHVSEHISSQLLTATKKKFARIEEWGQRFTIFGTTVYQEFLAGKRDLTCTAWAIPTRNIRGWKAPCYLMTDGHYAHYQEMLTKVQWEKYGVVNGVARDARCENCMVHCGYDPSGALGTNYQSGDTWKNIRYNFGAKPKPYYAGLQVKAFNGVSIGKGHLAEAKAAINSPRAAMNGAQAAFSRKEETHSHAEGESCGTGDSTQRDDLLAKIAAAKKNT